MALPPSQDLTALLHRWGKGDSRALQQLVPLVYDHLRTLARTYLRRERSNHTLQPTAHIHEAYLRLSAQNQNFRDRDQFFGVAAHLMRLILVDHARSARASKRGGNARKVSLEGLDFLAPGQPPDLLSLDMALTELAKVDERKARIVELRFFGGLAMEAVAAHLGLSAVTVRREMRTAEAWLHSRLSPVKSET